MKLPHCLYFFWLLLLCNGAPLGIEDKSETVIKLIEKEKWVVVKFYSDWCHCCKESEEPFTTAAEMIKESNRNITIIKVNTDKAHQLAERDGVKTIPAILFYRNGTKIDKFEGDVMRSEDIAKWALQNAKDVSCMT